MGDVALIGGRRERTGIVESSIERRVAYARKVERMFSAGEVRAIVDAVEAGVAARIKAEVDAIMRRQSDRIEKELGVLDRPAGPEIKIILAAVTAATGLGLIGLQGPARHRNAAWPRMLGYWLVRNLRPDLSLPAIGRVFGYRDHSTVIHGLRRFNAMKGEAPFAIWLKHPAIVALLPEGEPST